jgi:hypothetical protein
MSLSDRHSVDPALDRYGRRPTDTSLPLERRTRPGTYLIALVVILILGIALIAFGAVSFVQSTANIESTPGAAPTAENLLPDETGSSIGGAEGGAESGPSDQGLDRAVTPTRDAAPSQAVPVPTEP